jgi:hypothetical protein
VFAEIGPVFFRDGREDFDDLWVEWGAGAAANRVYGQTPIGGRNSISVEAGANVSALQRSSLESWGT